MKYSLGISNFLEEISSLSHSVVFLYFFALITEDGLLISPCFSWELCIQMDLSFSTLLFTSLLFTAICKAASDNHFAFLHFFSMRMILIPVSCTMSWTSVHSSSGSLSISCWMRVFAGKQTVLCKTLLAFALLHSVLQGQIYLLLQVFLDFLLLHSIPL